jgi:hypothetical protein
MGNSFKSIFDKINKKKVKIKVIMLGLDNAGKSTIL